ncbi:hypothetical protein [Desulfogranum japonicum]|uniref:hypothetical protein n=1 Tax=Desulfogranum japonicum TaxID=231447 RepID=UPI000418B687|nr:hypothetical protein [Desulfogranum japonicum]
MAQYGQHGTIDATTLPNQLTRLAINCNEMATPSTNANRYNEIFTDQPPSPNSALQPHPTTAASKKSKKISAQISREHLHYVAASAHIQAGTIDTKTLRHKTFYQKKITPLSKPGPLLSLSKPNNHTCAINRRT